MLIIAIISVIATVFMTGAILLQNPKSGGAGPMMGGSTQLIGHKRTTDILEKTTWIGITVLFLVCIVYTPFQSDASKQRSSANIERARREKVEMPAAPQQAPANEAK
ncbi:MAG TPA: preprotein translocase subunit SecG [Cytophagales bacterium]|nr:preprotein translocase subunit SecG [Cytophagales bacterium]